MHSKPDCPTWQVMRQNKLANSIQQLFLLLILAEFTCEAVAQSYISFIKPLLGHFKGGLDLLVSGGGAKNPVIMQ